jgi:hypothetical protein
MSTDQPTRPTPGTCPCGPRLDDRGEPVEQPGGPVEPDWCGCGCHEATTNLSGTS